MMRHVRHVRHMRDVGDNSQGERALGIPAGAGGGFPSLLLLLVMVVLELLHGGRGRVGGGALAAADGPALRVRLVELLDGVAVALHVAVAGRGRGVDAALALLEAGGGRLGGVPFVGLCIVS